MPSRRKGSASNARRKRWATATALGALLFGLAASGASAQVAGDDASPPPTTDLPIAPDQACAGGTEATLPFRAGPARLLLTDAMYCLRTPNGGGSGGLWPPGSGADPNAPWLEDVRFEDMTGPPGWLAFLQVPASWPAPLAVQDAAGAPLVAVRSPGGGQLAVYDPAGPEGASPLRFVGPDGSTLGTLSFACGGQALGAVTLRPAFDQDEPEQAVTVVGNETGFCLWPSALTRGPGMLEWHNLELRPGVPGTPAEAASFAGGTDLRAWRAAALLFTRAAGFPAGLTVLDEAGTTLPSVRSAEGRHLLVLVPGGTAFPDRPPTYRLVAPDGTTITAGLPTIPESCVGAVEVGRFTMRMGGAAARLVANDTEACVLLEGLDRPIASFLIPPEDAPAVPTLAGVNSNGLILVRLPAGFPSVASVRSRGGTSPFSAVVAGGTALFVYDPGALPEMPTPGSMRDWRLELTLLAADGTILGEVSQVLGGPPPTTVTTAPARPPTSAAPPTSLPTVGSTTLPFTGDSTVVLVVIGGVLVLVGGLARATSRRVVSR